MTLRHILSGTNFEKREKETRERIDTRNNLTTMGNDGKNEIRNT